jgi:hypothetical protein
MIDAGSPCPNRAALYALGTVHRCSGKPTPNNPARQSHESESHGRAPWELEGVSRAAWFRRRAEEKSAGEQAP